MEAKLRALTVEQKREPGSTKERQMSLVNVQVIENVVTPEQKQEIITNLTNTLVGIEGELSALTHRRIDEVKEGALLGGRAVAPCARRPCNSVAKSRRVTSRSKSRAVFLPRACDFFAGFDGAVREQAWICNSETRPRPTSTSENLYILSFANERT